MVFLMSALKPPEAAPGILEPSGPRSHPTQGRPTGSVHCTAPSRDDAGLNGDGSDRGSADGAGGEDGGAGIVIEIWGTSVSESDVGPRYDEI